MQILERKRLLVSFKRDFKYIFVKNLKFYNDSVFTGNERLFSTIFAYEEKLLRIFGFLKKSAKKKTKDRSFKR